MLSTLSQHIKHVSVLRRFVFAVSQLPKDLPSIWKVAAEFAMEDQAVKVPLDQ